MQGWFHGHGIFQTIGGMKFEGECSRQRCLQITLGMPKRAKKKQVKTPISGIELSDIGELFSLRPFFCMTDEPYAKTALLKY